MARLQHWRTDLPVDPRIGQHLHNVSINLDLRSREQCRVQGGSTIPQRSILLGRRMIHLDDLTLEVTKNRDAWKGRRWSWELDVLVEADDLLGFKRPEGGARVADRHQQPRQVLRKVIGIGLGQLVQIHREEEGWG